MKEALTYENFRIQLDPNVALNLSKWHHISSKYNLIIKVQFNSHSNLTCILNISYFLTGEVRKQHSIIAKSLEESTFILYLISIS